MIEAWSTIQLLMDGFLHYLFPSRASLMFDVVMVAMLVVLPLLAWSIYLVKYCRAYQLHKRVQLILGGLLLVTVVAFEADVRLSGWKHRAEPSPYYHSLVAPALTVHLVFATTSAVLWIVVIAQAWRRFAVPPAPGDHSRFHRRWGKLAAYDMLLTTITGYVFYWLAFVA